MGVVVFWLILAFVVGGIGSNRKIGFWGAFLFSVFLSPLIGGIITLSSKSLDQEAKERAMYKSQKAQEKSLKEMAEGKRESLADELKKLEELHQSGALTKEELEKAKQKLLS